jgi:hypothetical protein
LLLLLVVNLLYCSLHELNIVVLLILLLLLLLLLLCLRTENRKKA